MIGDHATDEVIVSGDICRKRGPWEISFQLRQASWGQGLATEALISVIEWFFGNTDESVATFIIEHFREQSPSTTSRPRRTSTCSWCS